MGVMTQAKRRQRVRKSARVPLVLRMRVWRDGRWYVGQLRELPAVISQGRTPAELRANIRDAYDLVIKSLRHTLQRRRRAASA